MTGLEAPQNSMAVTAVSLMGCGTGAPSSGRRAGLPGWSWARRSWEHLGRTGLQSAGPGRERRVLRSGLLEPEAGQSISWDRRSPAGGVKGGMTGLSLFLRRVSGSSSKTN